MTGSSTRHSRALIALLGTLTAIAPFSTDMYLPGLPSMAHSLGMSTAASLQTVSVFYIGMAAGQLLHGPMSDRWGRRPVLILGLVAYLTASLGCAIASSGFELILWRLMQAIGGCAGVVVARAVARDRYDPRETVRVLAFLTIVMSISPLIAPFCGGWILLFMNWRAIFAVQAAIALVLLVSVLLRLSESRPDAARSLARTENPLTSYRLLLAEPSLRRYLVAVCAPSAALFAWVASSATIVISTFGVAPQNLGYVFAVNAFCMALSNFANIRLSRRYAGERILRVANYVTVVVTLALTACAWTGFGGLLGILVPISLLIGSLGFTQTNAMAAALAGQPLRAGSLSALLGSAMYFAGAAGAAVVGWADDGSPLAVATLALVMSVVATANSAQRFANEQPQRQPQPSR